MKRRIVLSMAMMAGFAGTASAQQAVQQPMMKQPCQPIVQTKPVSEMPMTAQKQPMPQQGMVQQVAVKPTMANMSQPITVQLQSKAMPAGNNTQMMTNQSVRLTNTSGQWFNYTGAATFSLMDKSGKVVETMTLPEFRTQQNKMFKKKRMVSQPRSIGPNSSWEDNRMVTFKTPMKQGETYTIQCQVSGQVAKQELTYTPMPGAGQTAN